MQDETQVELDNSAAGKQKELLDVGVRALTDLATAGMQGPTTASHSAADYPGLRMQPTMSISHSGGVFITLEARNAEVTREFDEPVLGLVDTQARSLRVYAAQLQELSTQPVEVTVRRGSSREVEMILDGNCSVNEYDDEFHRAMKALFEKC